jgi:hypothetical protein
MGWTDAAFAVDDVKNDVDTQWLSTLKSNDLQCLQLAMLPLCHMMMIVMMIMMILIYSSNNNNNNSSITKRSYGDKSSYLPMTRFITTRPFCYVSIILAATTINVTTLELMVAQTITKILWRRSHEDSAETSRST